MNRLLIPSDYITIRSDEIEKVWTGFPRQRRTRSILPLRWASSFADNGINAKLAVRGRGQAPQPRSGASKMPGLRSAMQRRTIMIADCRSLHLTLSDSSSADLYI